MTGDRDEGERLARLALARLTAAGAQDNARRAAALRSLPCGRSAQGPAAARPDPDDPGEAA